jgi:hypothetical protein
MTDSAPACFIQSGRVVKYSLKLIRMTRLADFELLKSQ